jgi:ATP/maltotriose-dependent transcriptional regulator MalT
MVGLARLALADLRRRQGRYDEATKLLDEVGDARHDAGLGPAVMSARAAIALDAGDAARAADLAEQDLRAVDPTDHIDRIGALEVLALAAIRLGVLDRAETALAELEGNADRFGTTTLRAAARFCRGQLHLAAGDPASARDAFERATALFDQAGTPFEAARSRSGLARALLALDRSTDATIEATRARVAFQALGADADVEATDRLLVEIGPDTASRPDLRLTAREVEVLRLVGQGRSNEEIAAELFLSVRTIERHLANVYAKIGAHGRSARVLATSFASRHGIT